MSAFWSGFFTSLSLILAIGAQNAFVLKQGIKKEHVFAVCLICAFSDALLIFAGVFGFAKVLQKFELFKQVAIYGGFIFLFVYSLKSLYGALKIQKAFFLVHNTSQNLAK